VIYIFGVVLLKNRRRKSY